MTINGFRASYRRCPNRVRLPEICLADLRGLFTACDFAKITAKVALISDEQAEFLAEDDMGASFAYKGEPLRAEEWLGANPKTKDSTEAYGFTVMKEEKITIAKVAQCYRLTPKQFEAMAAKEGMTWKEYWQGLRGDALLPGLPTPNERKEARYKLYHHRRSGSSFPLQNHTS